MSRTLTTPQTRSDITKQMVVSGRYQIQVDHDGTVNLPASYYEYTVESRSADGSILRSVDKRVYVPDMPVAFKTKLKELHAMVVTDAENQGLLDPGPETDDF